MKPYVVVEYNPAQQLDHNYYQGNVMFVDARASRKLTGVCQVPAEHPAVFFHETAEEAQQHAGQLSHAHPLKNYAWCETKGFFQSVPEIPTKTIFNEKGVMPT